MSDNEDSARGESGPTPSPRRTPENESQLLNNGTTKNFNLSSFPEYDHNSVDNYFTDVTAWMRLFKINDQRDQFDVLFLKTPMKVKNQVRHINPIKFLRPYDELMKEIRRILEESEQQRMSKLMENKEMGDMRPEEFLNHLRSLNATNDENTLRNVWFMRLPQYLKVGLANQQKLPLEVQTEIADNIHAAVGNTCISINEVRSPIMVSEAPSGTNVEPGYKELLLQMQNLELKISEISVNQNRNGRREERNSLYRRNRSRTRSQNRPKTDKCWYHNRFGSNSWKYEKPCIFENQPLQKPPT